MLIIAKKALRMTKKLKGTPEGPLDLAAGKIYADDTPLNLYFESGFLYNKETRPY